MPYEAEQKRSGERTSPITVEEVIEGFADPFVLLRPAGAPDGRVTDLRFVAANAAACASFGVEREALLGSGWVEWTSEHGSEGLFDRFLRVLDTGEPLVVDDHLHPIGVAGVPAMRLDVRASRVAGGVAVTWRDVTERSRAREVREQAERRYQLIAEHTTDIVFLSAPDRTVEWVSPSLTEILGWHPSEVIGRPGTLLQHPDDLTAMAEASEAVNAGGQPVLEARFRHRDGGWRWMAVNGRPILDEHGRVTARTGSLRDVTAQHEAREALRESEERFRLLAENAGDIVFRSGRGGVIEWISPSIEPTMGWRPDELVGRTVVDLVHPDDLPHVIRASDTLDDGADGAFDARYRHRDGKYLWLSVIARPIRDEQGKVIGRTGNLRDVTALHEAQERIERFNATLEARVRERTEELETFTYTLSHDLRAPLRWIDGFAALLARDGGDAIGEAGRHHLAAIREAAQRMGRLSDALLDWARIGRHSVVLQPLDWPDLLASVAPGLDLGDPAWLAPAAGDPELVRRILAELVGNAVAHVTPGRGPDVSLAATRCDHGVRVAVSDRGTGIPADQLDRIFEPFVRLGAEDPAAGTGIGLAIARRAARMMGTDIEVRSTPGEGSTFSFVLPAQG